MEFKDVLKDKVNYPDTLAFQLGNGIQLTLGQFRSMSASDQAEITRRETELTTRQAAITADQERVRQSQMTTANLYTSLTQALEAIKNGKFETLPSEVKALFSGSPVAAPTPTNDPYAALANLERDSLIGPVVNVIKLVREEAVKAQREAAQVVEIQKTMATNYLNGVLEDRYDRLVPADKQDKITIASLIQSAVANKQFSADGAPNIKWAYKNATAGDTQAAHDASVAEAAVKKYKDDLAAAGGGAEPIFVGQPGAHGLDVHNRSGNAPVAFKSLDEAFAAAAKDKAIWSQVDGQSN